MNRKSFLVAMTAALLGGCSQLTAFNTLSPKDPATRVAAGIAYGANARHRLDVYAPPRPAGQPLPVVVFFYGGGWYEGRRQDYAFAAHAIAAQGFVVVVPDYRLYPEVTYPAFIEDGALAVRWVADHAGDFGGDPARILLCGHSAGAYNAIQLALNGRFLAAVGVEPGRIKGVAGLAGPYDFLPLAVPETWNTFGRFADLPDTQPINHVRADAPPIFLAHGTADETVELYNAEHLEAALSRAAAKVELKVYPGVDHAGLVLALSRPFRGKAPLLADLTEFLKEVAGDPR